MTLPGGEGWTPEWAFSFIEPTTSLPHCIVESNQIIEIKLNNVLVDEDIGNKAVYFDPPGGCSTCI